MGPSVGVSDLDGFLQGTPWAGRGRTRPALGWKKAVGHAWPRDCKPGGSWIAPSGDLQTESAGLGLTWQDELYFSPLVWEKVITSAPRCGMGLVVNSGPLPPDVFLTPQGWI